MENQNWFEVLLLLFGVVAGWMLSSRGRGRSNQDLIDAHEKIKTTHSKRKLAKLALAEAQKREAEEAAERERKRIKKMGLRELAEAVRRVFGGKE